MVTSNTGIARLRYVFVCGCARSGTTTMADLLRSHERIAFGRERYNSLFKRTKALRPELFEMERFCKTLLDGDTHHRKLDDYYQKLVDRFEQCTLIGDKIPSLYRSYEDLNRTFPGCKIIFMVRNILDVANSFERRRDHSLKNPGVPWPSTKGYEQAVSDWNESLLSTLSWHSAMNIKIVEYEGLYGDDDLLKELFGFLGLEPSVSAEAFWKNAKAQRQELESSRRNGLTSVQKRFIMERARFDHYQTLANTQR